MTDPHARSLPALDEEALALFARKGHEAGTAIAQGGIANGVKVRRVMQVTRDLTARPFDTLRILDLGCGEGVYAIEAALHGASVTALDARTARMAQGAACAARHGLDRVTFLEEDVRRAARDRLGEFDVVFLLGLLYHLDAPDVFTVIEQVFDLTRDLLIVDTLITLAPDADVRWRGRAYAGRRVREHADEDPPELRRTRVLKSIDNTFSVHFTRESLVRLLHDVGFTSVFECHVPLEPGKAVDRITLAARRGTPVSIATYPWVNGTAEDEIATTLLEG